MHEHTKITLIVTPSFLPQNVFWIITYVDVTWSLYRIPLRTYINIFKYAYNFTLSP